MEKLDCAKTFKKKTKPNEAVKKNVYEPFTT